MSKMIWLRGLSGPSTETMPSLHQVPFPAVFDEVAAVETESVEASLNPLEPNDGVPMSVVKSPVVESCVSWKKHSFVVEFDRVGRAGGGVFLEKS